ncbi:MAG: hypothetical protein ACOCRK_11580 [bacterium]
MWQKFWTFIWNSAEILNISLGRLAPWVFAQMIGCNNYKKKED